MVLPNRSVNHRNHNFTCAQLIRLQSIFQVQENQRPDSWQQNKYVFKLLHYWVQMRLKQNLKVALFYLNQQMLSWKDTWKFSFWLYRLSRALLAIDLSCWSPEAPCHHKGLLMHKDKSEHVYERLVTVVFIGNPFLPADCVKHVSDLLIKQAERHQTQLRLNTTMKSWQRF